MFIPLTVVMMMANKSITIEKFCRNPVCLNTRTCLLT